MGSCINVEVAFADVGVAMEYIQEKVIDLAKERLFDQRKSVSEVALR
jgi:hypothetical protein